MFVKDVRIEEVDGWPVGVVEFDRRMEVLSSAVLNGGWGEASAAFVMQVPKDYDCGEPVGDAVHFRDALGLPEDSVGMMTAAEVEYVFNVKTVSYEGAEVTAYATGGLSNHVVAGEVLDDWPEKHRVSERRVREMLAGTINVGVVSPVPLSPAAKVNLTIPLVEAKSVAMAERGYRETGTTSDSMAVFSPPGEGGLPWAGTGSKVGIAAARAVSAAVGCALAARNEHPIPMAPRKILARMGLDAGAVAAMSGASDPGSARAALEGLLDRADVAAAMDLAWTCADRADSLLEDGDPAQTDLILNLLSEVIGAPAPEAGALMDRVIEMLAAKAGGQRCRAARSGRWSRSSPSGART